MASERYSTQHCMNPDCIKPWQFMCVVYDPVAGEMCGRRGCDWHIHDCGHTDPKEVMDSKKVIAYIDIVGLLRAAK